MKKVNLIFKTHLDVGFTDLADNVVHKYFKCYIRDAIKTADYFRKSVRTGEFRYVWTVGSWLISEYLKRAILSGTPSPSRSTANWPMMRSTASPHGFPRIWTGGSNGKPSPPS